MRYLATFAVLLTCALNIGAGTQCERHQSLTFARWSGVTPERGAPVFVYSASGEEESLAGACLARCRELGDCGAVAIAYSRGSCYGIADSPNIQLRSDNDAAFFKKTCLELHEDCNKRWWALETTPGYYLNSENSNLKVILNTTVQECYEAVISSYDNQKYRSAQWIQPDNLLDIFSISNVAGNCILNTENKFTEPESYRVSNYYTFYVENQCHHDYPNKIDRCSYEEYYNQTLKHVDLTFNNVTKDQCKSSCELENRFVCRGFTWTAQPKGSSVRGLCDLHSEDLITMGSWLLRRVSAATYYRRVICLNISVECSSTELVVTYRPRGAFRGRVYVPGQPERCAARASPAPVSAAPAPPVRLRLPLYGDCDVHFAYAITKGPNGVVNRTMAYAMLMIQNNPIIQTAGDRWVRVGCSPDAPSRDYTKVDATVSVHGTGPSLASEWSVPASGASAVYGAGAPITVYVVRDHGETRPDAVALGEPLELRIETTDDVEIEAYHLVASSRLGDSSVLLLDSKGCPTGQVDFPAFTRSYIGGTQRLSAGFKAFRFPTSKIVRFALVVRFCDGKCQPINCSLKQARTVRRTNDTVEADELNSAYAPSQDTWAAGVVAQGGAAPCAAGGAGSAGRVPLELELVVGARTVLSADTLVRADHRAATPEEVLSGAVGAGMGAGGALVCVHELVVVALALAWLAVQLLLLLGCCVLVKRYRSLAEMNMQKDYQAFDNVGFDTVSTHRRVHWPDQHIDVLHTT